MAAAALYQKLEWRWNLFLLILLKNSVFAQRRRIVITKIKPGSAAALAGMRPGFLILAVNHKKVTTIDDLGRS